MTRVYNLLIRRTHPSKLRVKTPPTQTPATSIPKVVDLRTKMPPVYDQGKLGSCTANALAAAYDYQHHVEKKTFVAPSRLFIYYNERKVEHDIPDDAGAQLSDGVAVLEKYGCCTEKVWPYDISKFATLPPASAYIEAVKNRVIRARNVHQDISSMRRELASGYPIVVGINVYDSFESDDVAHSGIVPLPDVENEELLGGHAVLIVGYDHAAQTWLMRNSWGVGWGQSGYFTLPYAYLLDSELSSDLWSLEFTN